MGLSGERQRRVSKVFVKELVRDAKENVLKPVDIDGTIFRSFNFEGLPLEVQLVEMTKGEYRNFLEIEKTENPADLKLAYKGKGKPYFLDLTVDFSISHTDKPRENGGFYLWGCAVSPLDVGLDLQWTRPARHTEIANRYFSDYEQSYVEKHGAEGFFALWTRREAVGKAMALGLSMDETDFNGTVTADGNLATHVNAFGRYLEIHTARITEDLWGSCCFVVGKEE